jgi:hypothetical protein
MNIYKWPLPRVADRKYNPRFLKMLPVSDQPLLLIFCFEPGVIILIDIYLPDFLGGVPMSINDFFEPSPPKVMVTGFRGPICSNIILSAARNF